MATIEALNRWGAAWAGFMWRGSVDATVLLIVITVAWFILRGRISAPLAHGLFLLVLLKLVLPMPIAAPRWVAALAPRQAIDRLAGWGRETAFAGLDQDSQSDAGPPSALDPPSAPADPPRSRAPIAEVEPVRADVGRNDHSPRVPGPTLTPAAWLMIAWAAIVVVSLAILARAQRRARHLLRRAEPLDPASFPVNLFELCSAIGLHRVIPVRTSAEVASPVAAGLFRPRVILPNGLTEQLTAAQLRWVLLHELAHVRRGDLWVALLQRLVQVAYFFHPAAWLANRMIDVQREYACDDAALAACTASRRGVPVRRRTGQCVVRSGSHRPGPPPTLERIPESTDAHPRRETTHHQGSDGPRELHTRGRRPTRVAQSPRR